MTRRQQFLDRQRKYKRRTYRMNRAGYKYELVPLPNPKGVAYWRRAERVVPLWNGEKQLPTRTKPPTLKAILLPNPDYLGRTYAATVDGLHKTPHIHAIGFWKEQITDRLPTNWDRAFVGYHRRRVNYVGHKPGRLNGRERAILSASMSAFYKGYFPLWDPLGRHPDAFDVGNGEPEYSGPFPYVP